MKRRQGRDPTGSLVFDNETESSRRARAPGCNGSEENAPGDEDTKDREKGLQDPNRSGGGAEARFAECVSTERIDRAEAAASAVWKDLQTAAAEERRRDLTGELSLSESIEP